MYILWLVKIAGRYPFYILALFYLDLCQSSVHTILCLDNGQINCEYPYLIFTTIMPKALSDLIFMWINHGQCADTPDLCCGYPKHTCDIQQITQTQGEQAQMLSRYGVNDLWIMGRYSWSLDNAQMQHGYPVDNPTQYLPSIHGISTLNPAIIHTYTVQEHQKQDSFATFFPPNFSEQKIKSMTKCQK